MIGNFTDVNHLCHRCHHCPFFLVIFCRLFNFAVAGLAKNQDVKDDRRLHGRQLGGKGFHEDVEPAHSALHIRRGLSDASG